MYTVYKKRHVNSAEIRAYIKMRYGLGFTAKPIFDDIWSVYGHDAVSYRTVNRWIAKFKLGQQHVDDDPKTGRKRSVVVPRTVEIVKKLLNQDARYTCRDIAKIVGISTGSAYFILKKELKMRQISARWVPHLLTEEQKTQRLKTAWKCSHNIINGVLLML